MGDEIAKISFEAQDFEHFQVQLESEMRLLRSWFSKNRFQEGDFQCGMELEAWLIGDDRLPVPDNSLFLAKLDRESVVPELSKFNFELNVTPQYIAGSGLQDMQAELATSWIRCGEVAHQLEHRILSIGILPTVTDKMLCLANMSPLRRYAALNEQVLRLRGGDPLSLNIEGVEHLQSSHTDLIIESAATSIQVHLKVPQSKSVRYYNASLIASAFTVAMAANAPLLFGRRLWHDTRIPLFEQAADTAGRQPRVSFGDRYVVHSLLELFENNLDNHRVMLPVQTEQAEERLPCVRLHNGTIWNWNRPLIGFDPNGQPHLRIEHRPMSASPSLPDLCADLVFYLGLAHCLATQQPAPESVLPFETARRNFYSAARHGLTAEITWLDGKVYPINKLLRQHILECSLQGMAELGISSEIIEKNRQVLSGRVQSLQNGACWQLQKFEACQHDLVQLVLDYEHHQHINCPVHTWEL